MKKIFSLIIAIFLLAVMVNCGGGGGGDSSTEETTPDNQSSVAGNISAPTGTSPSSLTVVSLGQEASISSEGKFSANVYKDGVAAVAAMPEGKNFGLLNIVVTNSSKVAGRVVAASATKGITESGVMLNAKTTAVSLVFLSPYFITNDPNVASTLLTVIENDPKVAELATVIETVFSSADPLNEPAYQQALIDAVQSVINTLTTEEKYIAANKSSSNVKILQVPKVGMFKSLVKAATLSSSTYYADQDYITVKAETSGTGYGITVESRNVGSIDWIAETMKLDTSQFSSFQDFQSKALNKRTTYTNERQNVLGRLNAPAKSVFRFFDIIEQAFDWTFKQFFGEKPLDQMPVSSTEDGIYLIRSYSGSTGLIIDPSETSFIRSEVLNGKNMDNAALSTNVLMVSLDTLSIFVDLKSVNLEIAVNAGINAYEDQVSLVNNPTKKNLMLVCVSVIKAMGEEVSSKVSQRGILEMSTKSSHFLVSAIDLSGKLSLIGKVADRLLQMFTSATPMETSYVVVGNPFINSTTTTTSTTSTTTYTTTTSTTSSSTSSISTSTTTSTSTTSTTIASTHYTITDIGGLGASGSSIPGFGSCINNSGQVVGSSSISGTVHAFIYSNGTMTDLGVLSGDSSSLAYGINDNSQVVGYSRTGGGHTHAFLYSSGTMTNIHILTGDIDSLAYSINNNIDVVGYSNAGSTHAFFYSGGTMTDLGYFGGTYTGAYAINNSGQVVGDSNPGGGNVQAFLYSGGGMTNLGASAGCTFSNAFDINDNGQVVGECNDHATIFSGGTRTDLGTLTGDSTSRAYGINNSGQVVGNSGSRAFVYRDGEMIDLNSLIESNSGWTLTTAKGINDKGQIAGEGIYNGKTRSFLLTPN